MCLTDFKQLHSKSIIALIYIPYYLLSLNYVKRQKISRRPHLTNLILLTLTIYILESIFLYWNRLKVSFEPNLEMYRNSPLLYDSNHI